MVDLVKVGLGLTFEELASGLPPPGDQRASPLRQANVLALVLREELTRGRVVLDADHRYAIRRQAFSVDVLDALERLSLHD